MNAAKEIAGAFLRGLEKLVLMIGKFGAFKPIDDSKSGVKIGDKIYHVIMALNGCYWYLDDDGKKHPVAEIPNKEFEWVNIARDMFKEFRTCYRTTDGKVEVWSWYVLNDKLDVLREQHRITDSSDIDYPIGTLVTKIPSDWVMIDCDFSDATIVDTEVIDNCYKTDNGKVQIRTYLAFKGEGEYKELKHVVMKSTDSLYSIGLELDSIPPSWALDECDFASLSERHMIPFKECYESADGRLYLEGVRLFDNNMKSLALRAVVVESTLAGTSAGEVLTEIPSGMVNIPCLCKTC